MNVVSFETAKALKEAGFPQSDHMYAWHYISITGDPELCVSMLGYMAMHYFVPLSFIDDKFLNIPGKETVYAPTDTDILRELPDDEWSLEYYKKHDVWNVHSHIKYDGDRHSPHSYPHALVDPAKQGHKNPAEAAAAFWLSIKLKK